jgi:hypothetical protein
MPKQAYEMKLFSEGIASHPDPEDLTINSATYSVGLDSNTSAGMMGPRPKKIQARVMDAPYTSAEIIEDHKTGTGSNPDYTFIYFTPAFGANGNVEQEARIGFIENWYSGTTLVD